MPPLFCKTGKSSGARHKSLLPTYDVFDEDRYFEPAKNSGAVCFQRAQARHHDLRGYLERRGFLAGTALPPRPGEGTHRARRGNHPESFRVAVDDGKERTRLEMLQRVARDEKIPLAQVNAVGANDELIFDGHSVALDAGGEVMALGNGFEEEILVADLGKSPQPEVRSRNDFLRASSRFFPRCRWASAITSANAASNRWILGLSGGIDSALVAVLAADALGAENVLGVAMPARYSSTGSLTTPRHWRKISASATRFCRLSRRFWRWKNNWKKFLPAPSRTRPRKISSRGCAA